jgi:hypothetical protein
MTKSTIDLDPIADDAYTVLNFNGWNNSLLSYHADSRICLNLLNQNPDLTGAGSWSYTYYEDPSGTSTFTNLGSTITGVGTDYILQIYAGDFVRLSTSEPWAEVLSVSDNFTINLTAPYTGSTGSGSIIRVRDSSYILGYARTEEDSLELIAQHV